MAHYKVNGRPMWAARNGRLSATENRRLHMLCKKGKASWLGPRRTLEDAIARAGI
jgi:transcriptional/translational regulatory protein YebC/TACO1